MQKETPTTLSKIDSVLEYVQTSSSDLTLPKGTNPQQTAACLLVDVEIEVRELLEAAEKAAEYIENGIEFGYIDPDQESETPKLLRKAIKKAKGLPIND